MVKIESVESQKQQNKLQASKFTSLVIAGILATVAFNAVMCTDIAITGIPVDIVATLGQITVGENEFTQTVGHAIHFANGIGLALLFGYVAVPISKRFTKLPILVIAVTYSVIELIIAVWLGMLPALGAGFAGLNIAPEVAIMTLGRHIAFGVVLGISLGRLK